MQNMHDVTRTMHLHAISPAAIPDATPQHEALSLRPLTAATMALHAADTHLMAERDGVAVARASLWWRDVPPHPDGPLGYLGHYAAADTAAGTSLLNHAAQVLASHGCALAVGPIDGTTWRSYRLVTEPGERPPFFLEPQNPPEWPGHFRAAGFDALAHYTSAAVEDIAGESPKITATAARLEAAGYRFRSLDLQAVDRELHGLFEVSLAAFAGNFLYSPIGEAEFQAQYAQILPKVDPRLVLLAEHSGRIVGYVFALPDLLEAARTGRTGTVIVKTLAVHPAHAGGGIGGVLTDRVQQAAKGLGLTRVIHALMHESNVSQRISHRYGHPFRRYALFSRRLT
jgi:GNAT superfamily N-acetyltransferase